MPEATQVQEDKEVGTREPPETLGHRRERWGEVGSMQQVLCGPLKERMEVRHLVRGWVCAITGGPCGEGRARG